MFKMAYNLSWSLGVLEAEWMAHMEYSFPWCFMVLGADQGNGHVESSRLQLLARILSDEGASNKYHTS